MDTPLAVAVRARMQGTEDQARWLPAARSGEPWAVDHFYRSHQALVYAFCRRLLGRPDDAEDAMQATFIAAIHGLRGFRGDACLKTWLYRIAVREALRVAGSRRASPLADALQPEVAVEPGVEQRLAVQEAMGRMRADQRALLVLRYWEELSCGEMAQVLGVPAPVVSMRLSRARAEFRKLYGADL